MDQTDPKLPFPLRNKRGKDAPALVKCLLLAEFDIDEGSTLRHFYPNLPGGISVDLLADYMLPEGCHNLERDWTVFLINRDKPSLEPEVIFSMKHLPPAPESTDDQGNVEQMSSINLNAGEDQLLYCLNLVCTKVDASARRGAVVKALAIVSPYHFVDIFSPLLSVALEQYFLAPTPEILQQLYESVNAIDTKDWPLPDDTERALMNRHGVGSLALMRQECAEYSPQTWRQVVTVQFNSHLLELRVPLSLGIDQMFEQADVSLLVQLFGSQIMRIYNAVLTRKRVMFVGYNQAAEDICHLVLAACCLVSPPLTGVVRRAFPYVTLSDLSFLEVPGYIAGSTNPMFEQRTEWWDLLCTFQLSQGAGICVTSEERREQKERKGKDERAKQPSPVNGDGEKGLEALDKADSLFGEKIVQGIDASMGDGWARAMFVQYTKDLLYQELDKLLLKDVLPKFKPSIEEDRSSKRKLSAIKEYLDIEKMLNPWRCVSSIKHEDGVKLFENVRLLMSGEKISQSHVFAIFSSFNELLQSEEELQVLVSLLPEDKGGLYFLALGLLHTSRGVRDAAYRILRRIETHFSTCSAVGFLNFYMRISLTQVSQIIAQEEAHLI